MKRFPRIVPIALAGFAAAAAARAGQGAGPHAWGHGTQHMEQCLAGLNLSDSVRADIEAALTNGRAAMKTDAIALKAARTQMENDLASGADKSVLGQDAMNVDTAEKKMKADGKALRDQVFAQLSPDDQNALRACLGPKGGRGSGAGSTTPPSQP